MQRVVDFAKGKAVEQEDLHRLHRGESLPHQVRGSSTAGEEEASEPNTLKRYKGLREQNLDTLAHGRLSLGARRRETRRAVKAHQFA